MAEVRYFSDITRRFEGLLEKDVLNRIFREVDALYHENLNREDSPDVKIETYQKHVDLLEQRLTEECERKD